MKEKTLRNCKLFRIYNLIKNKDISSFLLLNIEATHRTVHGNTLPKLHSNISF